MLFAFIYTYTRTHRSEAILHIVFWRFVTTYEVGPRIGVKARLLITHSNVMKIQHMIAPATVLAFALSASVALAQTTTVMYTSSPVLTPVNPGTGVTLGSFTINGGTTSSISSVPLSLTTGAGGQPSNLSNCRLYSDNGTALSAAFSPVSGSNTVALSSPMSVGGSVGTTTISIRCDVAQNVASAATFTFTAPATSTGTATGSTGSTGSTGTTTSSTGSGSTNTGTNFLVNLDTAPTVPAGSNDVALANISLGGGLASGARISAIPLTITPGNGASLANLTGCYIRTAITSSVGATPLSNQFPLANGGTTAFTLGTPLMVTAGTPTMLSLACNVQPATPVGSSFTISIDPKTVVATDLSGNPLTVSAVTGTGPNGLPASTSGVVTVTAFVGSNTGSTGGTTTGTGTGTGATGGTVGVPNTGAGGTASSVMFVLALAALAALFGAAYLRYERASLN